MFGPNTEPVTLKRDCEVILVPDGFPVTLNADSLAYITQSMGGCKPVSTITPAEWKWALER